MDVLQTAVGIVGHIDAEVLFILGVPGGGQVGHGQCALHQGLFQLIAHHDMQGVGQLVGLGADQARFGAVDGAPDLLGGDVGQLRGEQLLQRRVQVVDKGAGTAHQVLKQAGLALVNAHRRAVGDDGVVVVGVDVQLIQRVAALVGDAVEVREDVPGHVVGRDAHIAAPELGGEGVLALGQIAVGRVKAPQLHDLFADLTLGVDGPLLVEKVGAHGLAAGLDVRQQRDDGFAQRREKFIALGNGQALLVAVQQDLIGVAVRRKIPGLGASGGDELFQIRREQAEIVRALGLGPGGHALAAQLGEGGVLVGGDPGDLVVLALQIADLGALLLGLGVGSGLLQKGGGAVVDQQVKAGTAQNLGGLGAAIGAALGRDGLGVKVDDGHGIQVGVQLLFQRTQADDGRLHSGDLVS